MFLDIEDSDPHSSMAIASLAVMEGPAPTPEQFAAAIAGRLSLIPRYRQRVMRVPFNLSQPVWVDDPEFDLTYHVRSTALPPPGDEAALCRLSARILSQRLDRERPLWEYWFITGIDGGRWAVLSKVHHCMVDGVGGNHLYELMFDGSPEPRPPTADTWEPERLPSAVELAVDGAGQMARARVNSWERATMALLNPRGLGQLMVDTGRGLAALSNSLRPVAPSSLTGPIGRSRRYGVVRVPFADLRAVSKARQVTINDVALAATTAAFRQLLLRRGEEPSPESIRAMVPVSVRLASARGGLANHVSTMLPLLPVDLADPIERLDAVHTRMVQLKSSKEAETSEVLNEATEFEPFAFVSLGYRAAAWFPQRNVITVVTNVPGPAHPLYLMGRSVLEILPYVPIAGRMRLGISVMTYRGQAVFGITGDYDSTPEVDEFAADISAAVSELVSRTQPAPVRHTRRAAASAVPNSPAPATAAKATPTKAVAAKARPAKVVAAKPHPAKAVAVTSAPSKTVGVKAGRVVAAPTKANGHVKAGPSGTATPRSSRSVAPRRSTR
jgi:diacylglycerol O-acyltransferase